jgi:glutamine amidotransferase
MITVIDYGVGNFVSVSNMLRVAGFSCVFSNRKEQILAADRIILPGIGSFDAAMQRLGDSGIIETIAEKAREGTPILGICLGAQLLTQRSEEGLLSGMGLLPASCVKFDAALVAPLKVPHMGWDEVDILYQHPVTDFESVSARPKFYFAHSYYMKATDPKIVLATSSYGHPFDCILASSNIVAAQFHPEKSHKFGLRLFSNFAKWNYEKS